MKRYNKRGKTSQDPITPGRVLAANSANLSSAAHLAHQALVCAVMGEAIGRTDWRRWVDEAITVLEEVIKTGRDVDMWALADEYARQQRGAA